MLAAWTCASPPFSQHLHTCVLCSQEYWEQHVAAFKAAAAAANLTMYKCGSERTNTQRDPSYNAEGALLECIAGAQAKLATVAGMICNINPRHRSSVPHMCCPSC